MPTGEEFAFSAEQVEIIERFIVENHPLMALKTIRDHTGFRLHDCAEILYSRYDGLRERSPERFTKTHKEYWSGWYS